MFTDPDLVSGDGIYSRYLTTYPFPGKYVFTIIITDNSNTAYVDDGIDTVATGMFTRTLPGPVVEIVSVGDGGDVFPPAKIGDLSAVYDNNSHLLLSWTVPYDGPVSSYYLLYSPSCDKLLGQDSDRIVFTHKSRAGQRVEHALPLVVDGEGGGLYVGLRAEDSNGNIGRISNLVYVNISMTPDSHYQGDEDYPSITLSESNLAVLGSVVGIIMVITLSLITSITCWLCRRRQKSQHGFSTSTRSSGVNVSIPSPVHSEATDTSSYSLSEGKHKNNLLVQALPSNTSFAANITPTYWSASQLLANIEDRNEDTEDKHKNHDHHDYIVSGQEYTYHVQPPHRLHDHHHYHHHHHHAHNYNTRDDGDYDNYGSDLVDEVLEGNTSTDTTSTLHSDTGSVVDMDQRNITLV